MGAGRPAGGPASSVMSLNLSTYSSTASDIAAARQADQVAFLHRAPFILNTYKLGVLPGFREDCEYPETQYQNLSLPVGALSSPNTILAQSVGTAVANATSPVAIGMTLRKSSVSRASTSRRRNAACCFSSPRRGRRLDRESSARGDLQ